MIDVRPIAGSFACEVKGLNLWEDLDQDAIEALRAAWSRGGVLVFRRQALSEDELVRFCAHFGSPDIIVRTDWQSTNRPEVVQITNMKNQIGRSIGGLGAGELDWHTDQSYVADPATGALLYMVEMPKAGGRTYWANLYLAYETLPEETKQRIESRSAVHDYLKRQSTYDDEKPMSAELRAKTPAVEHPIVNVHPVTGKKALYLDPTTMVGIAGLADAEGRALLDDLNAHATQTAFVYAHDWQIGDVVLWDNGCLLHRREAFDGHENRWLKRLTMRLSPQHHILPASRLVTP